MKTSLTDIILLLLFGCDGKEMEGLYLERQ
jgi:hypothetical protein